MCVLLVAGFLGACKDEPPHDGVLVVPREIAYDVLLRAEEIKENEKVIFGWVKEGQSIQDITKKGGYF